MKDFLKSQGLSFICKGVNPKNNRVFFIFQKSDLLNEKIKLWNEVKVMGKDVVK
jgi:hypothetical protein